MLIFAHLMDLTIIVRNLKKEGIKIILYITRLKKLFRTLKNTDTSQIICVLPRGRASIFKKIAERFHNRVKSI